MVSSFKQELLPNHFELQLHRGALAINHEVEFLSGLEFAHDKHVGVLAIVHAGDRFAIDLQDAVAAFEAGLLSGAVVGDGIYHNAGAWIVVVEHDAHAGHLDLGDVLVAIGSACMGIDFVRNLGCLGFLDFDLPGRFRTLSCRRRAGLLELRPRHRGQAFEDVLAQFSTLADALDVDGLPDIGGAVVLRVHAGEEEQHRNVLLVERIVIAGTEIRA